MTGCAKALVDLNGDGRTDAVVGGARLIWYAAPDWRPTRIADCRQEFTTDMLAADLDGDGDPDLVVPDGGEGEILWFENPRPAGDPARARWPRHVVGSQGGFVHDLAAGDFNGDGRLDLVARVKDGAASLWLSGPPGAWRRVELPGVAPGEGTAVADLDGDRRPDIICGHHRHRAPKDPAGGAWESHPLTDRWPSLARVATGDLNGDGRTDVVLAPSEGPGRLSWFESSPGGKWKEHRIEPRVAFVHGLQVRDVDGDRQPDVVFAEMAQSESKRVGYFRNQGGGQSWRLRVLSKDGSHNIQVEQLDRSGAIGILGSNWQGPPVELWRLAPPGAGNGKR